jgi:hypothetical protein
MAHSLQQGTKRVAIFTGATPTDGGTQVSGTNPLPVTSTHHIATDLEGLGPITVGTTAIELTFSSTTESIIISSAVDNDGLIYVGKSNVQSDGSNALTFLDVGEDVTIDYEDSTNPMYVVADTADQKVFAGAAK